MQTTVKERCTVCFRTGESIARSGVVVGLDIEVNGVALRERVKQNKKT